MSCRICDYKRRGYFYVKEEIEYSIVGVYKFKGEKTRGYDRAVSCYIRDGGLDVATWHSHAYNPDDEPGYFKQGCFYMGKENIVAWLSINDYVIDMNDSD